jgi:hypothetical protein
MDPPAHAGPRGASGDADTLSGVTEPSREELEAVLDLIAAERGKL